MIRVATVLFRDMGLTGIVVFIDLLLCQIPESTVAVSLGVRSCPEDFRVAFLLCPSAALSLKMAFFEDKYQ